MAKVVKWCTLTICLFMILFRASQFVVTHSGLAGHTIYRKDRVMTDGPAFVPSAVEMGKLAQAITDCRGWDSNLVNLMKQKLPQIRDVLNGSVMVHVGRFVVDGNALARVPCQNWAVRRHLPQGQLEVTIKRDHMGAVEDLFVNGRKIVLVQTPEQETGKHVSTEELYRYLGPALVPNVNLLVALLESPYLCPKSWKGKDETGVVPEVFFLGTEYVEGVARHLVMSAKWNGLCFEFGWRYLADSWVPEDFVAVFEGAVA